MRSGKQQVAVLLLAALVLAGAAAARSFEYDEAYSVFVTSPTPRPAWPTTVFGAGAVRAAFTAHAGPVAIAQALRRTDVHPPLYFWVLAAWRRVAGDGLFAMRLLSVLFALAALAGVGGIARTAGIPAASAMLLTLGCYGFAYTGIVARGFALAQALSVLGVLELLRATGRGRARQAFGGGLLLGAATFANYLSAFVGAAALSWLFATNLRRPCLWLAAGLGFAAFLPADLWFFLAQRGSRAGQFPPFRLAPSVVRLAEYATANLFGGLPLYARGEARLAVGGGLGLIALGLAGLVAWRWRSIARDARGLLLGCALAPPLGLLALGAAFDTMPFELRYLCFATPFIALLMGGALGSLAPAGPLPLTPSRKGRGDSSASSPLPLREGVRGRGPASAALGALLALQALAIAGLIFRPETMQPARAVARETTALAGTRGVIVLPRGNDGVGVVGPFLAELPDEARVLLVSAADDPGSLRARMPPGAFAVLAPLGQDAASRAEAAVMRAAFPRAPSAP